MARVLVVTWDGGGNVGPAVLLARELRRRGDAVRFLGQPQQRQALEREGFAFAGFRRSGPWTATGARGPVREAVGFLRLLLGRGLGRDLVREVEREPVDLVVVDCLLYGALDAVSRARIPYVVLVHSLFAAVERSMTRGAPGAAARLAGLDPWPLWAAADAVVVATLEELDLGGDRRRPRLHHTGPVLPDLAPASPPRGAVPTVLVSMSTTFVRGQADVLQRVLDALAPLPVRVVATTGPAVDPAGLRAPANADVHRYLPHVDVLPKASLVVGHGGHATTVLALAHDAPLVVLPLNPAFDQPLIGRRVQDLGAGSTLPRSASVPQVRAAVQEVLADRAYRDEAARLGVAVRAADGARTAADVLHDVAG